MRYFHCPCTIISFISHNKFLIWDLLLRRFLFLSNIYMLCQGRHVRGWMRPCHAVHTTEFDQLYVGYLFS